MLQELDIESYAVVEKLRVRFHAGLNLLTGETGSGKSIVVDSLALLFGARAGADVVRAGAKRARVSGVFDLPAGAEFRAWLEERGFDVDDELIVERQVLASGKSRAYVNGSPTTLATLKELAASLGDIHGQHDQQTLFSARTQLEMLDGFAKTVEPSRKVRDAHRAYRQLASRIKELKSDEQERLRKLDLLRYQAGEISQAALLAGEDSELQNERSRLMNLSQLQQSCAIAYEALYEGSTSASVQLKAAASALTSVSTLDKFFEELTASLESSRAMVDDAAFELSGYLDKLEAQPERQEQIEQRLALIEKLRRKYGPTLDDVVRYGEEVTRELDAIESADATLAELETQLQSASDSYLKLAGALSKKRKDAAKKLEVRVKKELAALAMERAHFEVGFEPLEDWSADGLDRIVYLFSANPGQPPRPLSQVASGGELSRVALALKTCLVGTDGGNGPLRSLVFDEVDSGVGGRVAESIGKRLKQLSNNNQVLCVTHLPQIAAFADAHFYVTKTEKKKQTFASIVELSDDQRIDELARMLSGAEITEAAIANARQLIATK